MQEEAEASQNEAEEGDGTAVQEGTPLVNFDETRYILKKKHGINSDWTKGATRNELETERAMVHKIKHALRKLNSV